jgi:hypothetical protein
MTRLVWDAIDARSFSFGVEKGVLYPKNSAPVVWNGLLSVSEEPEGADSEVYYYDGQSYVKQRGTEGFVASIEAITYPDAVDEDDEADFSYSVGLDKGTAIHLVYNAKLTPDANSYSTLDGESNPATFRWLMTSVPEKVYTSRVTSHLVVSTSSTNPTTLTSLTNILYGTDATPPRMPTIQEVLALYEATAIFVVTDNGDGTWTATGPDSWFTMLDATTFKITAPSIDYLNSETYQIHSW